MSSLASALRPIRSSILPAGGALVAAGPGDADDGDVEVADGETAAVAPAVITVLVEARLPIEPITSAARIATCGSSPCGDAHVRL
jgi:hypothetical protein